MAYSNLEVLPGDMSFVQNEGSFPFYLLTPYMMRLTDDEVLQYVNANVTEALVPTMQVYDKTSPGTTIGPFTTTTHSAILSSKMVPVVVDGVAMAYTASPKTRDKYVHVAFSGTMLLNAADASSFPCWAIRVSVLNPNYSSSIMAITNDNDNFKIFAATGISGMMPVAGYEVFPVKSGLQYKFELVAGYYGSVLPTQSFTPQGSGTQHFLMAAWMGG